MTGSHDAEQLPSLVTCLLAAAREEERLIDDLCRAVLRSDWSEATGLASCLVSRRGLEVAQDVASSAAGQV
jgi:hypothetical protein